MHAAGNFNEFCGSKDSRDRTPGSSEIWILAALGVDKPVNPTIEKRGPAGIINLRSRQDTSRTRIKISMVSHSEGKVFRFDPRSRNESRSSAMKKNQG